MPFEALTMLQENLQKKTRFATEAPLPIFLPTSLFQPWGSQIHRLILSKREGIRFCVLHKTQKTAEQKSREIKKVSKRTVG